MKQIRYIEIDQKVIEYCVKVFFFVDDEVYEGISSYVYEDD